MSVLQWTRNRLSAPNWLLTCLCFSRQRQPLAIARSLVTNPAILILNESTGALDPVTETEILDRLLASRQGKTTIMISHRPRVIQRADWIILLDKGELKLIATPAALSQLPGKHLVFLTP